MGAASTRAAGGRTGAFFCFTVPFIFFLPVARAAYTTPLPVLRTAREAHTLSAEQAGRGYPVHLAWAQITYYQPSFGALFLMDPTDGIYANPAQGKRPAIQAGDIVAVDGITAPGDVAPVLNGARFRILGHAPLPAAPRVSLDRLSSGAFDSRWVALEGIVRSIDHPSRRSDFDGTTRFDANNLILTLACGEERLDIVTQLPPGPLPRNLVDARVRLRAVVGSRFNQRKQFIGVQAFMPDLSYLQVLRPAPADPFALPLSTTTTITRTSAREPGHRVHVRGVVTSTFGDQHFSLMGPDHGIFVTTQDPARLHPGDLLDVVGFPSNGDYTSWLDGALTRRLGSAPLPAPVRLTAVQALTGAWDAELIELEGLLLDRSRGQNGSSLLLSDDGQKFLAVLSPDTAAGFLDSLQIGSTLRLRGICIIHTGNSKTPQSIDLLLRAPADVQVARMAPWWTPRHTLILAAILALLVFVIATRSAGLSHRVSAQTRQIQAQLEEARALRIHAEAAHHEKSQTLTSLLITQRDLLAAQEKLRYQATHDALTDLWNRAALLDFLHKEGERAWRTHDALGVLLLDVDHFKRVNDTYGHLAGDAVLCEIGRRITRSTRSYDIAGRYGGEEFLILLPGCDFMQTERGAERIRAAVSAQPFFAGDAAISLTISIGATVAFDHLDPGTGESESRTTDADLLSRADLALYAAKSAGRNRTVLRLPDPIPASF
ncbi:MAG: GGDEF domain-containing protein [Acidobacteriaceae bacterium]